MYGLDVQRSARRSDPPIKKAVDGSADIVRSSRLTESRTNSPSVIKPIYYAGLDPHFCNDLGHGMTAPTNLPISTTDMRTIETASLLPFLRFSQMLTE
jgi:hypothetical protein